MHFKRMGRGSASISDAVYIELVTTLYGSLTPVTVLLTGTVLASAVIIDQTGDFGIIGALTILAVIVGAIRVEGILSFRRCVARRPLGFADACWYGRRHMACGIASAVILGLLVGRTLTFDDALSSVVAAGVAFAFSNGVIARLSLRPFVAAASLVALCAPAIIVALLRMDSPHLIMAALILLYLADSFEMVRRTFNSMLTHILLRHKFERMSRVDPMTGVFNRSVLSSDLPLIMAAAGDQGVAIYAIDLDHFKAANDRFGHPVGDALLTEVAGRLQALCGADGFVIRMGGDEFIMVDGDPRSRFNAETLARRIVVAVSSPYQIGGEAITIGCSVGVAMSPGHGRDAEALLASADQALYRAKATRGGYVFADDAVGADETRELRLDFVA